MCHSGKVDQHREANDVVETYLSLDADGATIYASLFRASIPRIGGVLLLSDIFGRSPFYRALGRKLAAAGFDTLVPEMFSRLWPVADGDDNGALKRVQHLDQRMALADLHLWADHLEAAGRTGSVGVVGFCLGGSLAMLMSTRRSLRSCVVYYGITERRPQTEFAPYVVLDELPRIQAPLLGFWGDRDNRVSMDSVEEAKTILAGLGKEHEIIIYPDQPHAFLTFDSDSASYAASSDSWSRSLAFLGEHSQA